VSARPQPPTPDEYDDLLARLIDRGMSHAQVARLTDRQIAAHCFPPRDEQNRIVPPLPDSPAAGCVPPGLGEIEEEKYALFTVGRQVGVAYATLCGEWKKRHPDVPPPPE
jgi:hypothetical protein